MWRRCSCCVGVRGAAKTGGRGGLYMVWCATGAEAGGRRSTTEEVIVLLNLKTRERCDAAAAVV